MSRMICRNGLSIVVAGALVLVMAAPAPANNISVANVGLTIKDTATRTANVVFDLSWTNSWRIGENRDAAWVFVKFLAPGSSVWEHATMSTTSGDHTPAAGSTIAAVPDGKGVFIYSAANATNVNANYVRTRLCWNYGSNGYTFAQNELVRVSVQAIEMVYIPEGAFYLGSGGNEDGHFYEYTAPGQSWKPYLVTSESEITMGTTIGNLNCSTISGNDGMGIISNAFPKGYAAFYCMKYEVSQGQYADFLNLLTTVQATTRYTPIPSGTGKARYTIGVVTNYYSADVPNDACNYLSWRDGIAYADWAALRPMTELEFEKTCRGTGPAVSNEYAWGYTSIVSKAAFSEIGVTNGTELANPNLNCVVGNWQNDSAYAWIGPVRGGIFAATPDGAGNYTRTKSGAGYYGVMELSGNVKEQCVAAGTNTGRAFQGTLGDGVLDASGNAANNLDWPTNSVSGSISGSTYRGGDWSGQVSGNKGTLTPLSLRTSIRFPASVAVPSSTVGWRAVRQAP